MENQPQFEYSYVLNVFYLAVGLGVYLEFFSFLIKDGISVCVHYWNWP